MMYSKPSRKNSPLVIVQAVAASLAIVALAPASCRMYEEFNPRADEAVDIVGLSSRLSFGTSTGDSSQNSVTFNANGSITLRARNGTNNAGKIAGSEDGLTYFFKQVNRDRNFKLSADVYIVDFGGVDAVTGLTTSNGQEGFGLMARDWVPQYSGFTMNDDLNNALEYNAGETGGSGNMVMVGGIKRGVRAAYRTGVVEESGECVTDPVITPNSAKSVITWLPKELGDYSPYPTLEDRPDFPPKGTTYKLALEKNNSGFACRITPPAEKGMAQEYFFDDPDILTSIDRQFYYVGFFAARAATITVSNVTYYESDSSNDAPRIKPEQDIFTPSFAVVSPTANSNESYKLYATANVKGTVTVYQDGIPVTGAEKLSGQWMTETSTEAVTPYSLFDVPVYPLSEGENVFDVIFYPDENQNLTSNAVIRKTFTVKRKSYFDESTPIYVAPNGKSGNSGSRDSPLTLETAISYVMPGQSIIMLDGVYESIGVRIPRYNNGIYGAMKTLKAENRGGAIIDFKKNYSAKGFIHEGNYWNVQGIQVRNTPDKVKGYTLMGNNNLIEWVKTYNNGDTGFQISGRSTEPKSLWPVNNTVRFGESYNNKDAAQIDADGFAAKLTVGEGNRFEWCLSRNNCDDGWDLFTKKETGETGAVTLEHCIAYRNGTLLDGTKTLAGRNGFKMGGEGLSVPHVAINCLAFNNGAHGFTSNSNPAVVWTNCTSFDNGGVWNLKSGADSRNFTAYSGANEIVSLPAIVTNALSLYSPSFIAESRKEDKIELKSTAVGYVWFGASPGNIVTANGGRVGLNTINKNGFILSLSDVYASDPEQFINSGGSVDRNPDGTFAVGQFLKVKPSSIISGSIPGATF